MSFHPFLGRFALTLLILVGVAACSNEDRTPNDSGAQGHLCDDGVTVVASPDLCAAVEGEVGHDEPKDELCPDGSTPSLNGDCGKCADGSPIPEDGECAGSDNVCPDGSPRPLNGECANLAEPGRITVEAVVPNAGPIVRIEDAANATEVTIRGSGFVRPTKVLIGGMEIDVPPVRNASELRFRVPASSPDKPIFPGPADIEIENENGILVLGGGFTYFDKVHVESVTPARGASTGGESVELRGAGFVEGAVVTFGGRTAARVDVVDSGRLEAITPVGTAGPVDVRVFTEHGEATLTEGFTYFAAVELIEVAPRVGPTEGGTVIALRGNGFLPDSVVFIGLDEALLLGVSEDGTMITAETPGSDEGPRDVIVDNGNGRAALPGGFSYFDPRSERVSLFAVAPGDGSTEGGDLVEVVGNNFDRGAVVTFGGVAAECNHIDIHRLSCRTPAGDVGTVDVAVETQGGGDILRNGFSYRLPLRIAAVAPESGPVRGGTRITIRGTGFTPDTAVIVGVSNALNRNVIGPNTIVAETPPGSAGPADVRVRRDGAEAVLPGGFSYTDSLRLLAVEPGQGAMSGGTLVTLLGTGFVPGSRLTFGGVGADQVVVSNGATLTARTPRGQPGGVDVTLTTPSGESWTIEDGFTYYNPATLFGGTWGGPIRGSVNMTTLNGGTGEPLPEAFVMLGTDRGGSYTGFTDERGQITFSGDDVHGEQMITATYPQFTSASVVDFDAENVTLYLIPPPPPPSPGGGGGGPAPAELTGFVWGLDKYIAPFVNRNENEVAVAFVSTTTESMYGDSRPDPGPGRMVFGNGQYLIRSRLGDIAAVAVGGILNNDTNEFRPMRMGVHRFLFGIAGERIEDANIELNIPMDRVAALRFDNPPVETEVNTMIVEPWLIFDAEGAFPLHDIRQDPEAMFDLGYMGEPLARGMDLQSFPGLANGLAGLSYTFLTGLWTCCSQDGDLGLPFTETYAREVESLNEEIDVTPFIGIPRLTNPGPMGELANNQVGWTFDGGSRQPNGQYNILFKFTADGAQEIWRFYMPGHITEMQLPDLQDINPIPDGEDDVLALLFIPAYIEGWDIDHFEYGDFSVDNFTAWAQDYDLFQY